MAAEVETSRLRITAVIFFLKLFSSHIYCIRKSPSMFLIYRTWSSILHIVKVVLFQLYGNPWSDPDVWNQFERSCSQKADEYKLQQCLDEGKVKILFIKHHACLFGVSLLRFASSRCSYRE